MFFGYEDKRHRFETLAQNHVLRHAYLFFGDEGVGKKTFALMFANFLESGEFTISEKARIDSTIFSPDEKGTIGIDEMRRVKKFLFQKPFISSKRIAIIDCAEALTEEAASALLKVVEEPPVHALLIFISQSTESFFPPLLSRFTKEYFPRLSDAEVEHVLLEQYKISAKRAKEIAGESFGRIGRAVNLVEEKKAKKKEEETPESIIERNIFELRAKGAIKNSKKISWLLDRLSLVKRYNVNPKLQLKSVQYIIDKKHD